MEEIKKPINIFTYRGITLCIYDDDYGQCLYTILPQNNEEVSFGTYNADYQNDAEYIIDEYLDVITRDFGEKYQGACLRQFDNCGYRDIQLLYRQRVIKVFLVAIPEQVDFDKLKNESLIILSKIPEIK